MYKIKISEKFDFGLGVIGMILYFLHFFASDGLCWKIKADFRGGEEACLGENPFWYIVYSIIWLVICAFFILNNSRIIKCK